MRSKATSSFDFRCWTFDVRRSSYRLAFLQNTLEFDDIFINSLFHLSTIFVPWMKQNFNARKWVILNYYLKAGVIRSVLHRVRMSIRICWPISRCSLTRVGASIPMICLIRLTSSSGSGTGFWPGDTNPVTPRVFRTTYQESSDIIISTKTYPG